MFEKQNIYDIITNKMLDQMDQGIIPWRKPWFSTGSAISHSTGRPYSFLNQMLLGRPGEYFTFPQIQNEGGRIKKNEKSSLIVFWKWLEKEDDDGEVKRIPFLKYYRVFHIDQCTGLTAKWVKENETPAEPNVAAEEVVATYKDRENITIRLEESDRAFYRPSTDEIVMPKREQFTETAEYYGTLFHEMVHSTGHSSRLARLSNDAMFGNDVYSEEELVAEIGSSALVNQVGLETDKSFRNSTAYVQNWLNVLNNDRRFIVRAAGKAEKAVNYILGQEATTVEPADIE